MPIHDWGLVDSGIFHDFHLSWIGAMKAVLNARILPSPYYALAESALGEAIPDVLALKATWPRPAEPPDAPGLSSEEEPGRAVALASRVVVQELRAADPYALLARRIAIKDASRGDEVVAVIELVSRSNKSSKAERQRFIDKMLALLARRMQLLVIDLQPPSRSLPGGFHAALCEAFDVSPPQIPPDRPLQAASYEVLEPARICSRVVPLAIGDGLPEMPVFLLPGRFVRVPLEATYAEAFAGLAYPFRATLEGARTP